MSAQVLGINRGSPEGELSRRGTERQTEDNRTLIYEVQVDVKTQGIDTVYACPGLPKIGDTYNYFGEIRSELKCRRLVPKQREDLPILWDVTAYFEKDIEEEAEVEVDFEIIRVPITGSYTNSETSYERTSALPIQGGQVDQHTVVVTNSAEEPFDPPPEGDESMMVLRITRNEFVRDLKSFTKLNNSVNRDRIFNGEPRQWRMFIKAAPIQNHFQNKWRVTYTLHFRKTTWDLRIADVGSYYLDGTTKVPFLDKERNKVIGKLNGAGGQAAAGVDTFLRFQWLKMESWPNDLEATVARYYSEQGGNEARREAKPNNRLTAAERKMKELGFLA